VTLLQNTNTCLGPGLILWYEMKNGKGLVLYVDGVNILGGSVHNVQGKVRLGLVVAVKEIGWK